MGENHQSPFRARARGKEKMPPGRPLLAMTHKRRRILVELIEAKQRGERISMAELARRTGLYDYRDARRTVQALEAMGEDLRSALKV